MVKLALHISCLQKDVMKDFAFKDILELTIYRIQVSINATFPLSFSVDIRHYPCVYSQGQICLRSPCEG